VGPARRADLTLPADVPVAELLPQLVQLLNGEPRAASAPRRWLLTRIGGETLDPERSLDEHAVVDGAMVFLRDGSPPPPEPVIEDVVEATAIAVEVRAGRWSAGAAQALWLGAAGACLVGAAWAGWETPAWGLGIALGLCGGVLASVAGMLLRAVRQPLAGAVLAMAGLPLWAVGGASAAELAGHGGAAVAGGAGAVVVGALAAGLAGRLAAAPAAAASVVAAPLAVVAGLGTALGAGAAEQAAVLAVAWLAIADQLPRLATVLAGLSAREEETGASSAELRSRVDRGHRSLAWLLAGVALGLTGALVTLALSGRPAAWALCLVAALAAGLRARRYRFTAEVVALAMPALAGAIALEAALPPSLSSLGAAGSVSAAGLLLATAAGSLGLALGARGLMEPSPRRRRMLDTLELVANLALIPLAVAALGLFGMVYEQAHRFV
jgi:type VII secretion integral membrane protein EccD